MKATSRIAPAALAAFFSLVPAVSVGGALALAVLVCAAGAAAVRPSLLQQLAEKRPLPLLLIVLFALWVVVTTLWSRLPWDDQVIKILIMIPLGAAFVAAASDETNRSLALAGAIVGSGVLAVLLAIEAGWDLVLNRTAQPDVDVFLLLRNGGRGTTVLLALLWPAIAALMLIGGMAARATAIVLLAAGAWLSLQFGQAANTIGFIAGLAAFGLGYVAPRLAAFVTTGALTAWLLAAPLIAGPLHRVAKEIPDLPFSWAHRAAIWDYVSQRIFEHPIFGYGLETSRTVTDRVWVQHRTAMAVPIHPHSATLQIWYETGAVGALLATLALVVGGAWLARRFDGNRPGAAAACAVMASLGVIANLSYALWAEWWVATMFMAAALVGALAVQRPVRMTF